MEGLLPRRGKGRRFTLDGLKSGDWFAVGKPEEWAGKDRLFFPIGATYFQYAEFAEENSLKSLRWLWVFSL